MKDQFIASLFKDGNLVATLRATDLLEEALALAEAAEEDFDHCEIQTIYVRTAKGGE